MARKSNPRTIQQTKEKTTKFESVSPDLVAELFGYWVTVMAPPRKKTPTQGENLLMGVAIHDFGIELCRNAILGCSYSDFHMGKNKQKISYNNIELIFRNPENIERFASMSE